MATNIGSMKVGRGQKKVHVSELQTGMFVAALDRDWLDTPFAMQGFRIDSRDDIETLSKYCEHVYIDTLTWNYVAGAEKKEVLKSTTRPRHAYVNRNGVEQEHSVALGIHRQARSVTMSLLDEVRLGRAINTEQARETVKGCVDSVIRNPDAMLWMTRIRRQDDYTAEHCLNVCVLAIAFGRHLGLSEEDLNKLGLCGLLHDVGKMKVSPEVLNKPGQLTEKEFKVMKSHTVHGRNLLISAARRDSYQGMVDVAYSHHERMDGNGYPRGLKASGISTFSRMVSIVDAYDAMTTARCYDNAKPSTDALKEIFRCKGSHFDEILAENFIEMVGLYPPGSIVELVNGSVGIVFDSNSRYRHLPKVLVVRDTVKQPCREQVINLALTERQQLEPEFLIKRVITDGTYGVTLQEYRDKGLQLNYNSG